LLRDSFTDLVIENPKKKKNGSNLLASLPQAVTFSHSSSDFQLDDAPVLITLTYNDN
jgi:hypothetical protein